MLAGWPSKRASERDLTETIQRLDDEIDCRANRSALPFSNAAATAPTGHSTMCIAIVLSLSLCCSLHALEERNSTKAQIFLKNNNNKIDNSSNSQTQIIRLIYRHPAHQTHRAIPQYASLTISRIWL